MATTISPSDQAADLPKNLSIDQETMAKVPANTANNNKDVYGGNSNSGLSNKNGLLPNKGLNQKKLGYNNNNYSAQKGYYGSYPTGGYYPQAYQYPRYGYDMNYASGKTTTNTPSSYLGRSGSGYMDSVYSMYGPYMSGYGYDSYGGYSTYTPNWYAFDNGYKSKGYGFYGYGKENAEWLNELNRGPRAKGFKIGQPETLKAAPVDASVPDSKEYNKEDFSDAYTNAKLFVIKSYSEDDIHKSIKYNVWSSRILSSSSLYPPTLRTFEILRAMSLTIPTNLVLNKSLTQSVPKSTARFVCSDDKSATPQQQQSMKAFSAAVALSSILLSAPMPAVADISGLTPCKESKQFAKREKQQIKKLESSLKLYAPESAPALALNAQIEKTKRRFDNYGKYGLLCGADGLPHLIVNGDQRHWGEFITPGLLFLYIAGWIGWVGRSYLIAISDEKKPAMKEIIIDVPLASRLIFRGFIWPVAAYRALINGDLIAKDV